MGDGGGGVAGFLRCMFSVVLGGSTGEVIGKGFRGRVVSIAIAGLASMIMGMAMFIRMSGSRRLGISIRGGGVGGDKAGFPADRDPFGQVRGVQEEEQGVLPYQAALHQQQEAVHIRERVEDGAAVLLQGEEC